MVKTNPLLLTDFYKVCHGAMYPAGLTKLTSYFTPRLSRIQEDNELIMFGLQAFIKTYLVDYFNENFFKVHLEGLVEEYKRVLYYTLGKGAYSTKRLIDLHNLGYLPLQIRAVPEGFAVPMRVPMIEITNTHPDFVWLVNAIETLMSCSLWHTMNSANVGYKYRKIVNEYYDKSVDNSVPRSRALGDFSMRGQESLESAMRSSAAFCLSFANTATVPAILWLEDNYLCDVTRDVVAYGAISTEHSVMCSNYSIDGDEITMIKRLLTELYPENSFSVVCDSYDYWNMVDNIIPQCKEEILNHNGCMLVRGDSGDPVEIVTETVFRLWNTFGGTVNSKGFKVLNPHIKTIYGDSITTKRAEDIYNKLIENGFACNNCVLGVGSFSMQCLETPYGLSPFTRDTYGIAIKTTYAEDKFGNPIFIFKNPKTDSGNFKKSQVGMCRVEIEEYTHMTYKDGFNSKEIDEDGGIMRIVFKNGTTENLQTLDEIRGILHHGKF